MKKFILIILLIVFTGLGGFCVISSIAGLFIQPIEYERDIFSAGEGERINVSTEYLTPCVYEVEHKIFFIPSVHEYYYAFMSGAENKAYLVRMSRSFGEDLSGTGFRHVSSLELGVTGKVKNLKSTAELQELISWFEQEEIPFYSNCYLDTIYQVNYLWRLVVGIGFLIFSSVFVMPLKNIKSTALSHKIYCYAAIVVGIASMIGGVLLFQLG